jgi:GNAT superfamily N-acetyltransferase
VGSVQIRERTADDLPACVTALRAVYETDGYPANWPDDPERWISAPGRTSQAWVASVDGEIAGHLAVAVGLTDDAWRDHTDRAPAELIEIIRLFVAPKHRGKGVGARLMTAAHEYADDRGLQPVLEVTDDESAAIGLYESLGWQQVDTRPAKWTTPDGEHPLLRWYVARSSLIAF